MGNPGNLHSLCPSAVSAAIGRSRSAVMLKAADEATAIVAHVCEATPHFQLFKRALLDGEHCFGATSLGGESSNTDLRSS